MAAWIHGRAGALLLAALLGSAPPQGQAAAGSYEDWYPKDIAPPAGTQYPCALTALPRELPGIPAGDRRFINHVYSMLLRSTQAKLSLQKALAQGGAPIVAAHAQYRRTTGDALAKIRAEPMPAGLEKFTENVTAALELQRTAFEKAVQVRASGGAAGEEYRVPEGRAASQRLIAAWRKMTQRYPEWPREMQDSIYHHLCALDLF